MSPADLIVRAFLRDFAATLQMTEQGGLLESYLDAFLILPWDLMVSAELGARALSLLGGLEGNGVEAARGHVCAAIAGGGCEHGVWAEWGGRQGLLGDGGATFFRAAQRFVREGVRSPAVLGNLCNHQMEAKFGRGWSSWEGAYALWRAARPAWGLDGEPHVGALLRADAFEIAAAVRGESPEDTPFWRRKARLERLAGFGVGQAGRLAPQQFAAFLSRRRVPQLLREELAEATAAFKTL